VAGELKPGEPSRLRRWSRCGDRAITEQVFGDAERNDDF